MLKCMKFTKKLVLVCKHNGHAMVKMYSAYFCFHLLIYMFHV